MYLCGLEAKPFFWEQTDNTDLIYDTPHHRHRPLLRRA